MRRRIPDDLRDAKVAAEVPKHLQRVIGRKEVFKSYGPVSYAEAKTRHRREMAAMDRLFAEARAWLAGQGVKVRVEPPPPLAVPTLSEARAAILHWFHLEDGRRLALPVPDDPCEREAALEALRAENAALVGEDGRQRARAALLGIPASAALSGGPEGSIQRLRAEAAMPGILASAGFAVPDSGVLNIAVETVQRALVEGVRRELDRYGEWAGNADAGLSSISITSPPPPAPKASGLTFAALVDRYLAAPERAGLSPKTKLKYAGFRRVLVEIVGETKAAASVDRAAARRVQEERWLGKFGQRDRWIFCLTAAMLPWIRRAHDEANPPDAQCRLQGEGGVGRHQG